MENGGNIFSNGNRGQNGNTNNNNNNHHHHHHLAWDIWEFGGTTTSSNATAMATSATATTTTTTSLQDANVSHALMFDPHQYHNNNYNNYNYQQQPSIYGGGGGYGGGGVHVRSDPPSHVMCLKLGKRQYFEDTTTTATAAIGGSCSGMGDRHVSVSGFYAAVAGKKGRPYYDGEGGVVIDAWGNSSTSSLLSSPAATMAGMPMSVRCQVEGCDVALMNAKEYHRRHKVCEMHSKAPKVMVLGLEQRFCQQCSRFHAICEFDDSKRSCRRRLAGHNERRRKSSQDSIVKNPSQEDKLTTGRYSYVASPTERALSLLSSKTDHQSWVSPPDLSSRSSAALRELIAENRAAILGRQLVVDRDWHWHHQTAEDLLGSAQAGHHAHQSHQQHQLYHEPPGMDRYHESGSHITLDLMQAPSSAFGFLSVRGKSKEEVECSELWNSLEGAHVV